METQVFPGLGRSSAKKGLEDEASGKGHRILLTSMAIEFSVNEKLSTLEESCAQQKKSVDILIAVNPFYAH